MLSNQKKHEAALDVRSQVILVVGLAMFMVVSDMMLRLPINVQGETGLVSMAVLIVAAGMIRKTGIATVTALFAGVIAAIVDPSAWGMFYTLLTFAVLGIGVDLGLAIVGSVRYIQNALLAATLGHVLYFTVKWLYGVWVGAPVGVVANTLQRTAIEHLIFGVIGGLIGYGILMIVDQQTEGER